MIVLCPGCGHYAEMKRLGRKARPRCSICGCYEARVFRRTTSLLLNIYKHLKPRGLEEARRATYAGLLFIAERKGYKTGWAAIKFKTLYSEWPDGYSPVSERPSAELLSWAEQQKTRYAALRRKIDGPRQKLVANWEKQYALRQTLG